MRKARIAAAALVGAVGAFVGVQAAVAGENGSDEATMCVSTTQLRAENEVPASNSEATGVTQIKVRNDGTIEFMTHILNKGGETFVAGHIHRAPEGTPGPVVQSLFQGGPTSDQQIMQSGEVSNPVLGAAICSDPSAYYVNYHTTVHPTGAIRGQLG
jgi:Cu/Zn superoxide dismutase